MVFVLDIYVNSVMVFGVPAHPVGMVLDYKVGLVIQTSSVSEVVVSIMSIIGRAVIQDTYPLSILRWHKIIIEVCKVHVSTLLEQSSAISSVKIDVFRGVEPPSSLRVPAITEAMLCVLVLFRVLILQAPICISPEVVIFILMRFRVRIIVARTMMLVIFFTERIVHVLLVVVLNRNIYVQLAVVKVQELYYTWGMLVFTAIKVRIVPNFLLHMVRDIPFDMHNSAIVVKHEVINVQRGNRVNRTKLEQRN